MYTFEKGEEMYAKIKQSALRVCCVYPVEDSVCNETAKL